MKKKFQQHVFGFSVASLIFCKLDLLTSFSKSVEKMPILLFFFSAVHLLSRFGKNVVLSVSIKVSVASVWFSSSKSDFLQIGSFSKSVEKMSNLLLLQLLFAFQIQNKCGSVCVDYAKDYLVFFCKTQARLSLG